MRRRGATLTESVVVVAILGAVVGLLIPAVQRSRQAASRVASTNNLRQLILATHQVGGLTGGFVGGIHKPDPASLQESNRLNDQFPDFANPLALAFLTVSGRPLTGRRGRSRTASSRS